MFNRRTSHRTAFQLGAASLLALASAGTAGPVEAMQGYKWKKRPLIVFAPGPDSRELTRQRRAFVRRAAGFKERDIVVISIVGGQLQTWLGGGPGLSPMQMRKRFGVGRREFRAVLVGKDGDVKLSSSRPLTAARLFATIDAMPMRRREMRSSR